MPHMNALNAALPHILAAPKDDVSIDILCTRPDFGQRSYPDEISVSPEGGIKDERWLKHPWSRLDDGSPDPRIQVSILPRRVFDLVVKDRLHPGDTIIADIDTTAENLPVGQQLKIGTAVIEVTDLFNDGCVKWKTRYSVDAKNWIVLPEHIDLRLRGVLCKITQAGLIKKTDRIQKL
jgi:hypothetical protein